MSLPRVSMGCNMCIYTFALLSYILSSAGRMGGRVLTQATK